MNAGVQAMQQENGLSSALKTLAQSGGEGLHPLAASTYFHSALQMSSKHADIFYRFGFLPDDVASLMNEPEAQQVAQECMMQQMAQLMGGQEGLEALFGAGNFPNIEELSLADGPPAHPALPMPGARNAGMGGMSGLGGMGGVGMGGMGGLAGLGGLGGLGGLDGLDGLGELGGGLGGLDGLGGLGNRVEGMDDLQQPPGCPQQ